jgi:hypothetical protein
MTILRRVLHPKSLKAYWVRVTVFNATFNNISVILWRSVLLVDETRVPRENHRPVYHLMLYWMKAYNTIEYKIWYNGNYDSIEEEKNQQISINNSPYNTFHLTHHELKNYLFGVKQQSLNHSSVSDQNILTKHTTTCTWHAFPMMTLCHFIKINNIRFINQKL